MTMRRALPDGVTPNEILFARLGIVRSQATAGTSVGSAEIVAGTLVRHAWHY